ncbi:hypothetical protein TcasGA2_TC007387 [Tribolium castaneum]|uniref:Uncharacterized protein n=1 Tax=Tribolium castaneum TaxID=7070 RepID=D1ZZW0_TRICA|nr:hypothetical protein TcasGA2_TC007387 [Tribolium castaneum]
MRTVVADRITQKLSARGRVICGGIKEIYSSHCSRIDTSMGP